MTARGSTRLALLHANDGMSDGKRLLPKDWAGYVSSTRGAQPEDAKTPRYGAGFWILDSRQRLPSGTFAMEGSRGQYAIIVPSANVIVVRRGFDPLDARFDIDRFTHDALGVLKWRMVGSKRAAARDLHGRNNSNRSSVSRRRPGSNQSGPSKRTLPLRFPHEFMMAGPVDRAVVDWGGAADR